MGAIKSVDPMKPNEDLVADYITSIKKGKSAIIVSPTNQQADSVSSTVREKMKTNNLLGKKEVTGIKYTNLNFTEAEKTDWRNFKEGQIIQFNQNYNGIKRGTSWSVIEASDKGVKIKNEKGAIHTIPKDRSMNFDVCHQSEIAIAKGDKIRITRNKYDKDYRLHNGQYFDVIAVSKAGKLTVFNPISKTKHEIDKDFGFLDYAYCTTSHSSQGKTVDQVFISQPAATFPGTDAKQFYVSVSRGKEAVTIYTDDKTELLEHASEIGDRQSAIELVENRRIPHNEYVYRKEKEFYESKGLEHAKAEKDIAPDKDHDYEPGF